MDAVEKAKSGHPGAPMALAPLAYLLYTRVMKHNPANADWFDRDRFMLSAGHASMLLYASLHLSGYGLTIDDLKNFRQLGSPTAGHPERGDAAGIEATTGPLGQGISMAVGLALAEAMLAARYNRDGHELIDHRTFVVASDGDIQEGVASESCSLAGHLGLGKLTVFYDNNHIQLAGHTEMAFSEDVGKRFEAYGWHVQDLGEDLALDTIEGAIDTAARGGRPAVADHAAHPHRLRLAEQAGLARGARLAAGRGRGAAYQGRLRLGPRRPLLRARRGARPLRARPQASAAPPPRPSGTSAPPPTAPSTPTLWDELSLVMDGRLPEGWDADVPKFRPEDGRIATRKASQTVIQWAAAQVPQLVSGSADLEPSTLTLIDDGGSVSRENYAGRNVHYGVREHGMGAIVNGLCLHGFKAFGSTFFTFSDYMKGAIRLERDPAPAGDPRVHARLDRSRRGRADAPADRAARPPARHPEPVHGAPGGGQRDGAGVALRDRADDHAGGLRVQPAGPAGLEPERGAGRRDPPRRLRAARLLQGGRPRPDPDRHRLGGAHLHRGGRPAGGGRDCHASGVRALPGALRRAGRRLPRRRAAAERAGARVG